MTTAARVLEGAATYDHLGVSVASAGDVPHGRGLALARFTNARFVAPRRYVTRPPRA